MCAWTAAQEFHFTLSLPALDSNETQAHIETSRSSSLSPVEGKLEALDAGQQTSDDGALSVRQLVVRRGLSVLLMFVILAAGVFIAELLTRLLELDEWCAARNKALWVRLLRVEMHPRV